MNGAHYILQFLEQKHVHSVFGYPGGAIMPLYDALLDFSIKHYLARHEQGAAFSAVGYARSTNSVGVCFGTSGPGATNLITSMADAKLDSVPLLVITGQVAKSSMGSDAFQEVDVLGLSLSVCKHSELITDLEELPEALARCWELAQEGRPGPVLVDVPKDILLQEMPAELLNLSASTSTSTSTSTSASASVVEDVSEHQAQIDAINAVLATSEKPLLYVGGGVAMANAIPELRDFMASCNMPSVATLKGLGCVSGDHPYYLGMLGMHGLPTANIAVQECDVLLVVGARLDDRATGKLDEFAPHAKVIHIDVDAAEISKRRTADISIQADVKAILPFLKATKNYSKWQAYLGNIKAEKAMQYSDFSASARPDAPSVLHRLSEKLPDNSVVAVDVGQHQMWVAQHMSFTTPCNHLTSGGLGTMGFGLPAAIGAKVARPNNTVVSVSGDGSFMMNVQELGTLKRYGIPVKIVIMDNQRLGMVKQWQELFHEERYSETDLSCNPEFCALAKVFGLEARELTDNNQTEEALTWLLETEGAALLHVRLDEQQNVWPIVPPNTANHKMWEQPSCTD